MYREMVTVIISVIVILGLALASADKFMERIGLDLVEDDSPVEEILEDVVQSATGQELDFTDDSPE